MSVFIIEHVYKKFVVDKKDCIVLKDINFTLPDTGLVSIVGKSGSGKSTLLNILMGIEKPTKGKVFFKNKNIAKFTDRKFSKYHLSDVSIIFQHYNLFNDETVLRNIMIPLFMKGYHRTKAKRIAVSYLEKFNLQHLAYQKVRLLSGGEKQRIGIIRSLVVNSKVILCDEPTGALDEQNRVEVMEILQNISKEKLVVMVSHNKELVEKYSNQIITLKDGKIISNITYDKPKFGSKLITEKFKYSNKWYKKFLFSNLFKNFKKNLFSIIACIVSFTSVFLSFGFVNGSTKSQDDALKRTLSLNFSTVSETKFIDIDNSPIQYQKNVRPTLELIDETFNEFNSIVCVENINYFISDFANCSFNKCAVNNFSMIPLFDDSLTNLGIDFVKEGGAIEENFEEVIVNTEFVKEVDCNTLLGKEIVISSESPITYITNDVNTPFIKDTLIYSKRFLVKGIVEEFSFLNTPKIYYSYKGAKHFLESEVMENLTSYLNKPISYYKYLETLNRDDPATSYSYYLYLDDLSEINEFHKKVKELQEENFTLQVTSSALEIKETYSAFISSFSSALMVFIIIAFFGINFILGMISFSTFIENKKKTAIMTCLGSRNSSVYSLYLKENLIVVSLAFILSIIVSNYSQTFFNKLLFKKFGLKTLINIPFLSYFNIPFGLVITLFFIAFLFSTLFTLIPMVIYRKYLLADELRDE